MTMQCFPARPCLGVWLTMLLLCVRLSATEVEPRTLELHEGDKIVLIGNTLAEREQYFGHLETLLHARFPDLKLVVRNLGWSADELTLRPRSLDFDHHGHTLADHKPDVIFAFFGFNESFGGKEGLAKFESDLENFIQETTTTSYNGKSPPKLVLFSPIAHENLHNRSLPDGKRNNENIALYTQSMRRLADRPGVYFVDLYTPSLRLMSSPAHPLTFNGVHLTDYGYQRLAPVIMTSLFGEAPPPQTGTPDLERLRAEILEKNLQFFYDYRAVNGYYIYGGRKEPFGVVNFPAEFAKLRNMISRRDERVWAVAQGKPVSDVIDDSGTGDFVKIESNFKGVVEMLSPDDSRGKFKLPEGFEINLFASEVEFPELIKPVQMAFDAKGRLWVCTMPSYPQYIPGVPVDDRVLILEDVDGDGRADSCKTFADKVYIPTGIELGYGGVFLAQQPNLLFLKDTDGDDVADTQEIVLHGFDSADSHHSISAFDWGPGGELYMMEGTFHHTQVETPYGPRRCKNAGVFRYEPRSQRFDVFVSYPFANPWGIAFDRWGQTFVADASGGNNYFATAFSGDVDYPHKHGRMKDFLKMQWRPTAGCEIVSSRHFPDAMQGDYLLNNCIGFLGTLQYRMRDEGSGFHADPVEPLVQSADPNFRPVDLQFGPDGALYIVDWYNPLIGHMQHSIRDPNRDHTKGRIWRVTYRNKPLLSPARIAGEPIPALLELLKAYEYRTRYRARRELGERATPQVIAELDSWIAHLDAEDPDHEHHLLEALWVKQHHDVVDRALLERLLHAQDYRARAAATRVLCYWRDRLDNVLDLLKEQAGDEHPRVRLEALRAASFFHDERALDVAMETLLHDQDDYLKYTYDETMATLQRRISKKD